jgi:hypothetical protein
MIEKSHYLMFTIIIKFIKAISFYLFGFLMNPEIMQFDIIQSKLQQLKKTTPMLIYVITILNIALITFIMIVNI